MDRSPQRHRGELDFTPHGGLQIAMKRRVMFLVVAASASTAQAYDLGYHTDETIQALSSQGVGMDGREIVVNANMNVDIAVNVRAPTMVGIPPIRRVHWDDRFGLTAHASQRAWLLSRLPATSRIDCSDSDGLYEFASVVGFVLHGIQDYYAHSNHAELNTRYGTPAIDATFEEMMQPAPGFERLATVLRQNVPVDEGEALISGAYFTSPPPDITNARGDSTTLTHDRLNKDSRAGGSDYLYADYDRGRMHALSVRMAVRDSISVIEKFARANPRCFATLRTYRFSAWQRIWNASGRFKSTFLGTVFGHWRSGNPVTLGHGLEVTMMPPTGYPDASASPRLTWRYQIKNLGTDTISSITLAASEGLRITAAVAAPPGWRAEHDGNAIRWIATGAGLAPQALLEVELEPAVGASPGVAELITNAGRAVLVVGPVPPDYQIAMTVRAAAFVDDQDPKPILDALDVPADVRVTPPATTGTSPMTVSPWRGCGCGASAGADVATGFACVLACGLALGRRRRSRPTSTSAPAYASGSASSRRRCSIARETLHPRPRGP